MDTTYLGVVLTDDLSFAKDVKRTKSSFFIFMGRKKRTLSRQFPLLASVAGCS